jgi:hypothetical protein
VLRVTNGSFIGGGIGRQAVKGQDMNKIYEVTTASGWVLFSHHSHAAALFAMWQAEERGHKCLTIVENVWGL